VTRIQMMTLLRLGRGDQLRRGTGGWFWVQADMRGDFVGVATVRSLERRGYAETTGRPGEDRFVRATPKGRTKADRVSGSWAKHGVTWVTWVRDRKVSFWVGPHDWAVFADKVPAPSGPEQQSVAYNFEDERAALDWLVKQYAADGAVAVAKGLKERGPPPGRTS
jgi:hypothetical protein